MRVFIKQPKQTTNQSPEKLRQYRAELFVQTPRVSVHYVNPTKLVAKRFDLRAFMVRAPVIIALIIGIGVGSTLVWQSKSGDAAGQEEDHPAAVAAPAISSSNPEDQWKKSLDFDESELNVISNMVTVLVEENRHVPTAEELINEARKEKLKNYFTKRKSPFATDETVQAFLDSKNMKVMIAISFVESTMGKRCYYNNCSGIGGYPPNLRKYANHAAWVRDFDSLLERRYKGVPIEKFMGVYVQPGSPNWINGVKQILAELKKQGIE